MTNLTIFKKEDYLNFNPVEALMLGFQKTSYDLNCLELELHKVLTKYKTSKNLPIKQGQVHHFEVEKGYSACEVYFYCAENPHVKININNFLIEEEFVKAGSLLKMLAVFQEIKKTKYSSISGLSLPEFYYQNHPLKADLDSYFLSQNNLKIKTEKPKIKII